MKIYLHYNPKTKDVKITFVNSIMESDELFKFNNLKPMDFITTGLSFSCERPVVVKRLFSGLVRNSNGSPILDDFGDLVYYREWRMIDEVESIIHYVNTPKDYQTFFNSSQFMKKCFDDNFKVFIRFGDGQKLKLNSFIKHELNCKTLKFIMNEDPILLHIEHEDNTITQTVQGKQSCVK